MAQTVEAIELLSPSAALRQAVAHIYERDRDFLKIEQEVGELTVRHWSPSFASLVRIIVGQQLSSKAAQAIFQRLTQLIDLTPANFATCTETELQRVGMSRNKIGTCKQLAEALLEHKLDLDAFRSLGDREIVQALTQFKGIGPWTAEIYLLFCLERLNSFPAADLAIQTSYQRLKQLETRPTTQELMSLCQPLSPYRGAAAHLLWHYYRHRAN
jgi:DNA-3-methyladenine glycosylase II